MTDPVPTPSLPVCDTSRKFVRVLEKRADGLVAFEFSIGYPDIFVELLLPVDAFEEFCGRNEVIRLQGDSSDHAVDDWAWRLADVQRQRFR